MSRCPHCGYRNDNRRYCAGCGRRQEATCRDRSTEHESSRSGFLLELATAVERVFPSVTEEFSSQQEAIAPAVDLSRIAIEDGVVMSGEHRFRLVGGPGTARLFFGEILMVAGVAILFAACARVLVPLSMLASVKLYFAVFVAFSFVTWWFLPFAIGGTPVALALGEVRLVREEGGPVRGDLSMTMLLWIVSLVYSLFPLIFAEYLYLMVTRDHYQPLLFQVAGIHAARPA